MTFGITWNRDPGEAWEEIARLQVAAIEAEIIALIDGTTDEATAWMRANAKWTDRTGDARAALYADLEMVAGEYAMMILSHGPAIAYNWYLETVSNGRFAILGDAEDHFRPILQKGVEDIVRRNSS